MGEKIIDFSKQSMPIFGKIKASNIEVIVMKKLVVEFSEERLITPSGLSLVGSMLGKSDFAKKCNRMSVSAKRSQPQR